MDMKSLCALCKHARGRPLLRPKSDFRQSSLVAPHKFAEAPTMPLRVNLSRENFHPRYPDFFDLALILVGGYEFARIHPALRQLLREQCHAIITRRECGLSGRINPLPKIFFGLGHFPKCQVVSSEKSA